MRHQAQNNGYDYIENVCYY